MKSYDVLTIGGGPAGITRAKILGGTLRVGVIRPEEHSLVYCANNPIVACAEDILVKQRQKEAACLTV